MLPYANKAFARLVAIIDHPISAWGPDTAGEYLSYTLNLLDHLNRMSSENRSPNQRLKGITAHASEKYSRNVVERAGEDGRRRTVKGKDWTIHKALDIMKGIEFWVSEFVISSLSGGASPYLEMRSAAVRFMDPSMADFDKKLHESMIGVCRGRQG